MKTLIYYQSKIFESGSFQLLLRHPDKGIDLRLIVDTILIVSRKCDDLLDRKTSSGDMSQEILEIVDGN